MHAFSQGLWALLARVVFYCLTLTFTPLPSPLPLVLDPARYPRNTMAFYKPVSYKRMRCFVRPSLRMRPWTGARPSRTLSGHPLVQGRRRTAPVQDGIQRVPSRRPLWVRPSRRPRVAYRQPRETPSPQRLARPA
ncbi:hypothetical protein GY45DRAFT_527460 [Cubamyces sp. BRFM 1775]|nr:hypothetical protein GY45DRAFT_527460 [Cubamyces sp. BRFM 1775]